jgi:hypothetical protein
MRIVIMDYQPRWPEEYAAIEAAIRRVTGEVVTRIDHIGSTSVPGLAAKDIIDIQLSVTSVDPVEAYGRGLETLGYFEKPGNSERNKRYFRESGEMRRTHIHIRESGAFGQSRLRRDSGRSPSAPTHGPSPRPGGVDRGGGRGVARQAGARCVALGAAAQPAVVAGSPCWEVGEFPDSLRYSPPKDRNN